MIKLILFILVINKAIAFDCQKKLTIAKIDKITEILPYKLIDYIDDIKDENLDAIQKIENLAQNKITPNPFINFINYLNDRTSIVWYNDKVTFNQLFKSTNEDFNEKLDIISVTLINSRDETNYALGGKLLSDRKTFVLGKELPYQKTPVKVVYTPAGLQGDRLAIYKDKDGSCKFIIRANGETTELAVPIFWTKDSWHRIMATWKCNSNGQDEMKFFVDGEQQNIILAGSGFLAGSGVLCGSLLQVSNVDATINLKDPFNKLYIGSNYLNAKLANCRIDNLKISKYTKAPVYMYGQPLDKDYTSNISLAMPVVEDLYTTYLLDFDKVVTKVEDLAILKDRLKGIFDFEIDIFDDFDIIDDNSHTKALLETLINTLKPAVSRAFINYVK